MADNFELYRQTVFIFGKSFGSRGVDVRKDFTIITAYNQDGHAPSPDPEESARLNHMAHLRLRDSLLLFTKHGYCCSLPPGMEFLLGDGVQEVAGCSPDQKHREPGWASNVALARAVRIGKGYRQEAIFWVSAGQLYLVDTRGPQLPQRPSHLEALDLPTPELLGPLSQRVRTLP